ncbi:MAG TPA: 3-deoxy-8-phosphooctulonate synthase, partial [Bacteroidales bacterium]|nr:3-deoxy-8-phosphooctulonate synthase [Bacteroidales bacterium]
MIDFIPNIRHSESGNFFLIAGPCIIENDKNPFEIAEKIVTIADALRIPYIFKASYRKANRSKLQSFTGIGDKEGLEILKAIRERYDVPVITDIHTAEEAAEAAEYVDILQIPAFLCRQTDLLVAAALTGKPINIKKGQFLSAQAMTFAVDKVLQSNNKHVMLTERGTMFGYQDLVVDFRNIPWMQQIGVPVIADITHSL